MQLQILLTAVAAFAMSVTALPEAIPEFLESRAQCIGGIHKVGAGCAPNHRGKTSCSADHKYVIQCLGDDPTWKLGDRCSNGYCQSSNCICV